MQVKSARGAPNGRDGATAPLVNAFTYLLWVLSNACVSEARGELALKGHSRLLGQRVYHTFTRSIFGLRATIPMSRQTKDVV